MLVIPSEFFWEAAPLPALHHDDLHAEGRGTANPHHRLRSTSSRRDNQQQRLRSRRRRRAVEGARGASEAATAAAGEEEEEEEREWPTRHAWSSWARNVTASVGGRVSTSSMAFQTVAAFLGLDPWTPSDLSRRVSRNRRGESKRSTAHLRYCKRGTIQSPPSRCASSRAPSSRNSRGRLSLIPPSASLLRPRSCFVKKDGWRDGSCNSPPSNQPLLAFSFPRTT